MEDNNEQELPLDLYGKGKRTTVDRIVLLIKSLGVLETTNESSANRIPGKVTLINEVLFAILQDALALLKITWQDHIIMAEDNFYSFNRKGLLL